MKSINLIVFGATGGIGSQVIVQALAAGHRVTAVARRPSAITLKHECLEVLRGDVLDPTSIRSVFANKDAVISALGVPTRAPTSLYSDGVKYISAGMQNAGINRLLCISASGLDPGPFLQRLIAKPLLWRVLKNMYTDLARMEAYVQSSNLEWTIVRPPRLTNKPHTGHYQIAVNKHLTKGSVISRADVADYMINHLNDSATYRALVEIAY